MYLSLVSAAILVSILLVLVILAQNPKGGGLSSQFGGSGASNLIGIKKTSDLLEKLTWGFIFVIMCLSLVTHFTTNPNAPQQQTDEIIERAKEQQNLPEPGFDLSKPIPEISDENDTTSQ